MDIFYSGLNERLLSTTGLIEDQPIIEQPFKNEGDFSTFLVRQKYRYFARAYRAESLDSPVDEQLAQSLEFDASRLMLVEQSEVSPIGGGLVEVAKTYATLPNTYIERCGQAVTRFGFGEAKKDYKLTRSFRVANNYAVIDGLPADWAGAIAKIYIKIGYASSDRNDKRLVYGYNQAVCVRSGNEVSASFYLGDMKYMSNVVDMYVSNQRVAMNVVADGFVEHRFIHLATAADKIPQTYSLYSMTNVTFLDNSTFITASQYADMIANNTPYQCGDMTTARWHGNIYEVQTPFVYAT